MANTMKEVAKILGIELGEEFIIQDSINNPYILTEDGLRDCAGYDAVISFYNILLGKQEIQKSLLTRQEKEYLEHILSPYQEDGIDVVKNLNSCGDFIRITIYRDGEFEKIELPYIKHNDLQFNNLEHLKKYTFEELELFKEEE